MRATEDRLRDLEQQVVELSADLRVLRGLVAQDHASALNKIRYVTEKVLHGLCTKHGTSWGKQEPTLENMIGPLIANKLIPKNAAVHVRTIQTNASPGSHFQEDALTATHVQVAQIALLELLEWYYQGAASSLQLPSQPDPVALPRASTVAGKRRRWLVPAMFGVALAGSATAYLAMRESPKPAAVAAPEPPAPKLREPVAGLDVVKEYEQPVGTNEALGSESRWQAAADDFAAAAKQPGAPVRYRAGEHFARAAVHVLQANRTAARDQLRAAIAVEPTWAAPHAMLAHVLAHEDVDAALASAREAQRLEPRAWNWIAATAHVYRIANRLEDAIGEYRRALVIAPKQLSLLAELSLVYHAAGFDDEAARYAGEALAIAPDLVEPRIVLAERALQARDSKTAEAEASRALAVDPRSVSAMLALADAKVLGGDQAAALAMYRKAVDEWKTHRAAGAPEARLSAAETLLAAAAKSDGDRRAALERHRSAMRTAEIARARAAAARAERLQGVKISEQCMQNPLAAGCI